MDSPLLENIETLIAAILFAAIFFFGDKLRLPGKGQIYHRRLLSFAAGISIAYIFVHLLPELHGASNVFIEKTAHLSLPFPAYRVSISALIGFMLAYGLENLSIWLRQNEKNNPWVKELTETVKPGFILHIVGLAMYAWLVSYLMVRSIEEGGGVPIVLYAAAMGFHFLSIDYSLNLEYGRPYKRFGKNVLALASLVGWTIGILTKVPVTITVTLLGVMAGAVIMNTMILELPKEKEGRFLPFLLGGFFYTALLVLIG